MGTKITTANAPAVIGPYSQAVQWGKLLFISGQIALDNKTNTVEGNIIEQTESVLKNIRAILQSVGGELNNILKVTVYLKDIKDISAVNEIYGKYFNKNEPARSAFEVAMLPKDAKIEIEAIAGLD